jgi:ATP-dependent RNA helicase RhlE
VLAGVDAAGYTSPTPIQEQAIPVALDGGDVLGLAQTGTGKTASFMLPILQRLISGPRGQIRALIVAPTRELAEQIHQTARELGKNTAIRSLSIYGGVSKGPQAKALRRGADIVVACPGRLLDHVGDGAIDLSGVEVLVLDEADTMCDMGFLPDIRRIISHLPRQRQTLFFAATMPGEIRRLSDDILIDPTTVQIGIIAPAKTVSHALYPVTDKLKKKLLLDLLERTPTGRLIIFTRTKARAKRLAGDLEKVGFNVAAMQGNLSQNRRQQAIDGFRNGKFDVLVATDLASRGIDVSLVSHVINFDMPNTVDAYIHRIGRTGRADNTGEAFTFMLPEDEFMVRKIESILGMRIERRRLEGFEYGSFSPHTQAPGPRQQAQSPRGRGPNGSQRRSGPPRRGGGGPGPRAGGPQRGGPGPRRSRAGAPQRGESAQQGGGQRPQGQDRPVRPESSERSGEDRSRGPNRDGGPNRNGGPNRGGDPNRGGPSRGGGGGNSRPRRGPSLAGSRSR